VQIFGNDSNRSKFDSGVNSEEIDFLRVSPKPSVFSFPVENLNIRIYKTITLPVVLYGCKTWSLTLKEEHRLGVFEGRALRMIFGPTRG
jgi:hypothetical protein